MRGLNTPRGRLIRTWLASLIAVVAIGGGALAATHLDNNFHTIVAGDAYRSAQPSADELRAYRDRYGIATIVNLRGAAPGQAWYDQEVKAANKLGMRHIDFPMNARTELTQQQSLALMALLQSAPKPVLIHCKEGADRTGLASALYLAALAGADEQISEAQLSVRYGHIGIPFVGPYEMDRSFETMEPLLGFFGS